VPPALADPLKAEKLSDATLNVRALVLNLFGSLDNLAWMWVCEKKGKNGNGTQLHREDAGLGKKNNALRDSFSEESCDPLSSLGNWLDYVSA
jgi:hypothetical protein